MKNNNNNASGGIGFCGLLTILFIGLKLTRFIDWSWIWVLAPIWIPIAISIICIVLYILYVLIKERKAVIWALKRRFNKNKF